AAEAPDTLLLAEAFWLMEGYFVRTLGMHRVYNSAFMNMLRDEKNAEYRLVIRNTLDFDPQILKRYVNFMNNPDERTAVDQFGRDDKYFGVCTVMVTLPGLPMFGHGQVEGFAERYGMEFRRAQLQEEPDPELVARHQREIFPLLHRRELFAEVDHFQLYDFETPDGSVNEDVFAFSNQYGQDRTLVVYHNRFADTRGWIRRSVGATQRGLADGLSLVDEDSRYLVLRDERSGLEFLRRQRTLFDEGLYLELGAYATYVFLELREIDDAGGRYGRLADWLGTRGVPSIEQAMAELELQPLHDALRRALDPALLRGLLENPGDQRQAHRRDDLEGRVRHLLHEARALARVPDDAVPTTSDLPDRVRLLAPHGAVGEYLSAEVGDTLSTRAIHATWALASAIDAALPEEHAAGKWIDQWDCGPMIESALRLLDVDRETAAHAPALIVALLSLVDAAVPPDDRPLRAEWLHQDAFRRAIGVSEHDGVTWFNREDFERTVLWVPLLTLSATSTGEDDGARTRVRELRPLAEESQYRLAELERLLTAGPAQTEPGATPAPPGAKGSSKR
ncbi:MAG TPA: alpha-amylase family protein, partial [Candidatus Caenarcaniphilales bacterium]|nr:alpha-amylase family protein [Candidatus Caenarcaniphilales bacterium]